MHSVVTEQALLAVEVIAFIHGRGSPFVTQRQISEGLEVPHRYLEPILQRLSSAGLVESKRGTTGGYQFSRDPHVLSAAEVVREFQIKTPRRSSKARVDLGFAQMAALSRLTIAELAPHQVPA